MDPSCSSCRLYPNGAANPETDDAASQEGVCDGGQRACVPLDVPGFASEILENLYDGVYFVDTKRTITYWNQGAKELTGYSREEAVGRRCYDNFLAHVDESGQALCFGRCPLAATIADGQRRQGEIFLRHKAGHRVPVSVRVAALVDKDSKIVGAVEIFSDISAKKQVERRANEFERLAFMDPGTGVRNRRYAELKIKQALEEASEFNRSFGLIMLDLDEFKEVNDTFGHVAGDKALSTVCESVTHNLRPSDILARWGGDEFVVLTSDVDEGHLQQIADRCAAQVAQSVIVSGDQKFRVSVSVGATLLRAGDTMEEALQRADAASYESKANGGNCARLA